MEDVNKTKLGELQERYVLFLAFAIFIICQLAAKHTELIFFFLGMNVQRLDSEDDLTNNLSTSAQQLNIMSFFKLMT